MRPLARWGTLPLLAAPMGTWALGLGEIELHSALNQPLNAEIALVSPTPEDLAGLKVTLAPPETFDRLGIERPGFLASLQFDVRTNAAGQSVISVRSTQSITEPFVTMLVRATWPAGDLMREYTVFLDPPVLLPEPPAPAAIQPAETRPPQQSVAGGAISRPAEPAPAPPPRQPTPAPAPRTVTPGPAPISPQARAPGPQATTEGTTYGPVQNAETLWGISTIYRPAGVSMNQMMLAVYEANPQAFGSNMNLLRRGAILRIPPMSALQATSTADATAEVRRQEIEWEERRGNVRPEARLVLVPPSEESISAGAGARGADTAELDALRGEVSDLEQQLSESQRLLAVRDNELADLQRRLSEQSTAVDGALEPAAGDETSVEPAGDQLFVDESGDEVLAEPGDEGELIADETPVEPVVDETPSEPAPTSAPTPAPTPVAASGPSLVERILALVMSPLVLIGVGVVAVLVAALLFLRRRREEVEDVTGQWEALEAEIDEEEVDHTATTRLRSQTKEDFVVVEGTQEEADELSSTMAGPVGELASATAESEELTEPESAEQTMSSQTVINLDQADPIAEADFHMAYGLYDQAADLVGKALEADPGNRELELKLLEVFFVWGNKESFLQSATSLRQSMGDAADSDWGKVVIMGKQICPDEPLFADARAAAGEVDLDLEAGDTAGLDISFEEEDAEDVDLDFGAMAEDDMELEATGGRLFEPESAGHADLEITGRHDQVDLPDEDMLDIGARTQAGLEAALFTTDSEGHQETSPDIAVDGLDVTQESPTIETPRVSDEDEVDWGGITMESPTIEQAGPEESTLDSTAIRHGEAPTVETPMLETHPAGETRELTGRHDMTAELDLDDLGIDETDINALPDDLGQLPDADGDSDTREQPAMDVEDDLLSATGVTQVLRGEDEDEDDDLLHTSTAVLGDEEATMMAPSLDATGVSTEVLDQPPGMPGNDESEDDLDLNLDDLTMALKGGGDTVEQPRSSSFDTGMFDGGGSETPVDLDIGLDVPGDNEPTGTEEVSPLDPQTMTEVGTKLDLARAYIDMGDPDGAKSILEEVLSEGDSTQRQEAQSLIDALPA